MANQIDTQEFVPSEAEAFDLGQIIGLGGAQSVGTIITGPYENKKCKGLRVVANITAASGTSPTLVVTIQGWDPVSKTPQTILASARITTTGQTVLKVFPGAPATANVSANDQLPEQWQVSCTFGGTSPSYTGTITACFLP